MQNMVECVDCVDYVDCVDCVVRGLRGLLGLRGLRGMRGMSGMSGMLPIWVKIYELHITVSVRIYRTSKGNKNMEGETIIDQYYKSKV